MSILPLKGIYYNPEKIKKLHHVVCPPYDLITPEQIKLYQQKSPFNVVNLILRKPPLIKEYKKVRKLIKQWIECKVLKVIERFRTTFVGGYNSTDNVVLPLSNKMEMPIKVEKGKTKDALDGQKVIIKMTKWSNNGKQVYGEIIEVIGKVSEYRGKPEIEAVEIRQKQT